MLRKLLIGNCVGTFRCASARAGGVDFQACSIDHSDISPFKINDLRAVWSSVAQNLASRVFDLGSPVLSGVCRHRRGDANRNCVRPSNVVRSLAAIWLSRRRHPVYNHPVNDPACVESSFAHSTKCSAAIDASRRRRSSVKYAAAGSSVADVTLASSTERHTARPMPLATTRRSAGSELTPTQKTPRSRRRSPQEPVASVHMLFHAA